MKRCHLSIRARTTVAQRLPADYEEQLAIFRAYCSKRITEKKIQPSHITNMDEVPLTFDIPVNHTVEHKGTSTVSMRTTGHEKSAFTVVLGCHDFRKGAALLFHIIPGILNPIIYALQCTEIRHIMLKILHSKKVHS
ncbi:hypothetical protein MHYP_G00213820 [Metynnis hypsauchen]